MKLSGKMLAVASVIMVTLFGSAPASAATYKNVVNEGINAFSKVKITNALAVEYVQGDEVAIEFEYENSKNDTFRWKVENGVLMLYREQEQKNVFGKSISFSNAKGGIRVRVTAPYNLTLVEVGGASSFKTEASFKTTEMNIMLSGASFFECRDIAASEKVYVDATGASSVKTGLIEAPKARFDLSGASHSKVFGTVAEISTGVSGASSLQYDGRSTQMLVGVSGASKLHLIGTYGEIKGSCSGASRIKVVGTLETNSVNCSGASSCKVNQ